MEKKVMVFGLSLLLLTACKGPLGILAASKGATSKAAIVQPSGAKISQSGSVEVPAKQSASNSEASIALPKGTLVTVALPTEATPGKISITLAEVSAVKLSSHSESASMPQNFRPPLPPSANELATAEGLKLYFWLSIGLILLAGLLLWGEHWLAAGVAGAGSLVVPIVGRFVSDSDAITTAAIVLAAAGSIYGAWYWYQHRLPAGTVPVKTS